MNRTLFFRAKILEQIPVVDAVTGDERNAFASHFAEKRLATFIDKRDIREIDGIAFPRRGELSPLRPELLYPPAGKLPAEHPAALRRSLGPNDSKHAGRPGR